MVQVWRTRRASLVAQVVKNLSARSGDAGSILNPEDPLEKEMATHSCSCLEDSMDRAA